LKRPQVKVHVIKDNKGKIIPRSQDMYSKLNGGEKITLGAIFSFLMDTEIGKCIGKGKVTLIGIYL